MRYACIDSEKQAAVGTFYEPASRLCCIVNR